VKRADGRLQNELREISIERGVNEYAEGSALIKWGGTRVHCTATVEERVPEFLRGKGSGWVTAEYSMLPRATRSRNSRENARGGREFEIQRLIGRALRDSVYLGSIGERTIVLDCDVLQADGGTRAASITASFVCLTDALRAISAGGGAPIPIGAQVAAVSVGMVNGVPLLDLSCEEDISAEVDFNVVTTSAGEFAELQGSGEKRAFSRSDLNCMIDLAREGLEWIFEIQREALGLSQEEASLFDSFKSTRM
jgi:ribonuclease PH